MFALPWAGPRTIAQVIWPDQRLRGVGQYNGSVARRSGAMRYGNAIALRGSVNTARSGYSLSGFRRTGPNSRRAFGRYYNARPLRKGLRGRYQSGGRWACRLSDTPEKKFKESDALVASTIPSAAAIKDNAICTIVEGDGASQRSGREICLTKVWYKGRITRSAETDDNTATTIQEEWVMMYLVQDTQCNGAAATVDSDTVGIFTDSNLFEAFRTPFTYGRFKILASKKIKVKPTPFAISSATIGNVDQDASVGACTVPFSFGWRAKSGKGIPITYSGSDGAIDKRITNNVFLVMGTAGLTSGVLKVDANNFVNFYDV